MKKKILYILLSLIILSCIKTYKIPKNLFALNPYETGEILIFKSNTNKKDTIMISNISNFISVNDPLNLFANKEEFLDVGSIHGRLFFSIVSREKKGIIISFNFTSKYAWFYGKNDYTLDELNKLSFKSITIKDKEYNDVWVLNATDREYEHRDNFIEKLYWSKSNGIIRFDKKNNEVWILTKIDNKFKVMYSDFKKDIDNGDIVSIRKKTTEDGLKTIEKFYGDILKDENKKHFLDDLKFVTRQSYIKEFNDSIISINHGFVSKITFVKKNQNWLFDEIRFYERKHY